VQEKSHPHFAALRARLGRDVHEMVVVHPDEVGLAAFLDHRLRKAAIHFLVARPVLRIEDAKRCEIVKERPDDLVREAVVEVVYVGSFELDAAQGDAQLTARRVEGILKARGISRRAGPADPRAAAIAQHGNQRRDETARAALRRPTAFGLPRKDIRQPIGDNDQPLFTAFHSTSPGSGVSPACTSGSSARPAPVPARETARR
jgi:hypothetical protein